jgi:hypothetical protein
MKKIVFLAILFFTILNTQAQIIINVCAKEIYSCTSSKMTSIGNPTDKQVDIIFTTCTRDTYNNNLKSILSYYHMTTENSGTFEKFSDEVNEKILNLSLSDKTADDSKVAISQKTRERNNIYDPIKVTISVIENRKFPTFVGKDKNGVEFEFIYLKPFPTDIMYRYNRIRPGDRFLITYYEIDIFDEGINDFITYKYITQLLKQ